MIERDYLHKARLTALKASIKIYLRDKPPFLIDMSDIPKETDVDAFIKTIKETGTLPPKHTSINTSIESRIIDTANQLYEWLIDIE